MKSTNMNIGYRRLGITIGAIAAIAGTTVLVSANSGEISLSEAIFIAATFFVVHFVTFVGIGWTRANIQNSDKIYSIGARGVAVFAPLSLVAFIAYSVFIFFIRFSGTDLSTLEGAVTLLKAMVLLLFLLAGPVFVVIVAILPLTLAIPWIIDGFLSGQELGSKQMVTCPSHDGTENVQGELLP